MEEQVVKLIGTWASPFSFRTKMALKIKGIEFEYIEEDLSNQSDLILKYNPVFKNIPILIHNHKPVCDTLVILDYIDEISINNNNNNCLILPQDPYQRAVARFWAKFVDEKVLKTAMKIGDANEELSEELKLMEKELKGQELFGGKSVGYLDMVAFSIIYWIQLANGVIKKSEFITENKLPLLYKWMEKMKQIEFVKELLPPIDQLVSLMAPQKTESH